MNTVYVVAGDNGMGNSGNAVFGIYPTEALAKARVKVLKAEGAAEYIYWDVIDNVGPEGADCNIQVCG
jgi:hypothetical protein